MVRFQYDRDATFDIRTYQIRKRDAFNNRFGGLKGGGAYASKSVSNSIKIGTVSNPPIELEGRVPRRLSGRLGPRLQSFPCGAGGV